MNTKFKFLIAAIIIIVLLSACVGDESDTSDVPDEGFDFSEEEVAEPAVDEGFDFSEEEVADSESKEGFTFSEEEVAGAQEGDDDNDGAGMEFDEDEAMDVYVLDDPRFPPDGITTWLINYDEGSVICETFTQTFPANEPDTVTILLGDEADTLVISGLGGGPDIYFYLMETGEGGVRYQGEYGPIDESFKLEYDLYFISHNSPSASYLEGWITSEEEGCKIRRGFNGQRQD